MLFVKRGYPMPGVWDSALRMIETKVKPHNFDMWIKPVECLSADAGLIHLRAPNRFIKDWFEDNYLPIILEEITNISHQDYRVAIEVREDAPAVQAVPEAVPEAVPVPIPE